MTAYQVYEQSIKPLSVAEKLTLARLIINEIVPEAGPLGKPEPPAKARQPRESGQLHMDFAQMLLSLVESCRGIWLLRNLRLANRLIDIR